MKTFTRNFIQNRNPQLGDDPSKEYEYRIATTELNPIAYKEHGKPWVIDHDVMAIETLIALIESQEYKIVRLEKERDELSRKLHQVETVQIELEK